MTTHARPEVAILLGLCNGAATLRAQLDSFARQKDVDWTLVVSDDGSKDAGPRIVKDFARMHPERDIRLVDGPRQGFARNFLSMIAGLPEDTRYAALSDQDDVWLPEKLAHSVETLSAIDPARPGLYVARTMVCDADLRPIHPSPWFKRPPGFRNALLQSIGGGNTMMLNRGAIALVRRVLPKIGRVVAHDWFLYQLVSGAGGHVLFDSRPLVLYRQHGANLIGSNEGARASWSRLRRLAEGRYAGWLTLNIAALEACSSELTQDAREVIAALKDARRGGPLSRLRALARAGLYRQRLRDDVAIRVMAALGRL